LQALQAYRELMPDAVRVAVHQLTRASFPKAPAPFLYSQAVYRLRVVRAGDGR
jgi:hypothetical protein